MIICDISVAALLVGKRVEVESPQMCVFIQYHLFMLIVFGTMCMVLMGVMLGVFACCSTCTYLMLGIPYPYNMPLQSLERCAMLLLMCFGLALGLEGLAVLLVLVSMLMWGLMRGRGSAVHAGDDVNSTSRLDGEISIGMSFSENDDDSCPICMATGSNVWFRTRCGHIFHLICISGVRQNSCPLCRGCIFKTA